MNATISPILVDTLSSLHGTDPPMSDSAHARPYFAVQLHFDEQTEGTIEWLWDTLRARGLAAPDDGKPRFSLAIVPGLQAEHIKDLTKLATPTQPIHVRFTHVGGFDRPRGVLFLGAAPSIELLEVHRRVHEYLGAHELSSTAYYQPGAWTPHVTLVTPLRLAALNEALSTLGRFPVHLHASVTRCQVKRLTTEVHAAWHDEALDLRESPQADLREQAPTDL